MPKLEGNNRKQSPGRLLTVVMALILLVGGCSTGQESARPAAAREQTPAATSIGVVPAETADTSSAAVSSGVPSSTPSALPTSSFISASQLDEGIKAKKQWQIIDVREPSEFATGHVPGAKNIPLGSLENKIGEVDKDQEVVLVCLTGARAYSAWQLLTAKGYDPKFLKVLVGGMEQWRSLGSAEITDSIGGC